MTHRPCDHCLEATHSEDITTLDNGESVCPPCETDHNKESTDAQV